MIKVYIFFAIVAIVIIISAAIIHKAQRHISDSEAEEGCDTCRWLHIRMDRDPCNQCDYGSKWEKQDE